MACKVVLWYVGNARPLPLHLDDCAWPRDPNNMLRVCGEWCCVSCVGHVSGEE